MLAATGDGALADELRGAWERAGEWLLGALERGGGLVRWGPRPAAGGGLGQQGWRDADTPLNGSGGGILHEDGAVPPRRSRTPTRRPPRSRACAGSPRCPGPPRTPARRGT